MTGIIVRVEDAPDAATQDALSDGLDAYNVAQVGPDPTRPLWLIARDRDGTVIGGLKGGILWTWFHVDWLWVADTHRNQAVGSRLLCDGEAAARAQGCTGVFLNTFSFQAPEFYRRHGYIEFARLEEFPPGHTRFWMRKMLAPAS